MSLGIPLLFLVAVPSILVQAAADCAKFATNGSAAAYYDYYRFYDFRNLKTSGTPASTPSTERSVIVSAVPWKSGWNARYWLRPKYEFQPLDMLYTSSGAFISNSTDSKQFSTYLSLYTTRLANNTQLAGELDFTEFNVTYASIRMLGRVRGASGAVAGFFTYHNDTTESDIEVLTRDPSSQVHYSNQPTTDPDTDAPISGSTFNVSVAPHQTTSEWNTYRLDWIPGRTTWYANGDQVASTDVNVPDTESMIIMNMWSNGGKFSGQMNAGDEAWFDLQWVELLFNITSSPGSSHGGTTCSVESSPGSPKAIGTSGASPSSPGRLAGNYLWWLVRVVAFTRFFDGPGLL